MGCRILIATDKWRGSFDSAEAGASLAAGVRRARPDAAVEVVPLADGGEGTIEVLRQALGGTLRPLRVDGPLGDPVEASWLELPGGRGVLESARIVGAELVPARRRDPLAAGSRGIGQAVRMMLDAGCRDLVLGVGGTLTVDGGAGLAAALGYRLVDGRDAVLPDGGGALADLARLDPSGADPRIRELRAEAWCDVANLLLGPRGAAPVYAPQKGAGAAAVERLEAGLERLARRLSRDLGRDVATLPGAGAGGGLGAGAAGFLGAELVSGAGRVLEAVGFSERLAGADLVLTGEGRYDGDAMPGKLPDAVLAQAAARGVRAAVVCGDARGAGDGPVPVFSRHDLIDNRGWDLGPAELAELAGLAVHRLLAG